MYKAGVCMLEGVGISLVETGKGLGFPFGLGSCSVIIYTSDCNQKAEEIPYECLRGFPD